MLSHYESNDSRDGRAHTSHFSSLVCSPAQSMTDSRTVRSLLANVADSESKLNLFSAELRPILMDSPKTARRPTVATRNVYLEKLRRLVCTKTMKIDCTTKTHLTMTLTQIPFPPSASASPSFSFQLSGEIRFSPPRCSPGARFVVVKSKACLVAEIFGFMRILLIPLGGCASL
jgi:hypothetical protein